MFALSIKPSSAAVPADQLITVLAHISCSDEKPLCIRLANLTWGVFI